MPPGERPAVPDRDGYSKEYLNAWLKKARRHVVAAATDKLIALKDRTPEQDIAMVLGRAFLEDSLSSHSPFAALIGGGL